MWGPRRLTNLWGSTACCTDNFIYVEVVECGDPVPSLLLEKKIPLTPKAEVTALLRRFPKGDTPVTVAVKFCQQPSSLECSAEQTSEPWVSQCSARQRIRLVKHFWVQFSDKTGEERKTEYSEWAAKTSRQRTDFKDLSCYWRWGKYLLQISAEITIL
jgi:hypothetical protein